MNKSTSPTAGSAASSETSESQSVSDEFQGATPLRATKNWKKIKEIGEKEDKRPPWRMVSVSTLPKADKNAIIRAKLLDVSRRMRAGKNQVGIQTDYTPTKLMKEVKTQVCNDLNPMEDKEILTDGRITMRQENSGEFLLTHSVTQMTDGIRMHEAQTQTSTPRISHKFFQDYNNRDSKKSEGDRLDESLAESERKLIKQIRAIKEIDRQLNSKNSQQSTNQDEGELTDDSLHNNFDSKNHLINPKVSADKKFSEESKSTISSWHFDFSDEDDETDLPKLPRRLYTEGYRPWHSFKDLVIGRKLANMRLSPTPARKPSIKKKSVTWSDAQQNAVANLINEANALLDVFDQMSIILGPDLHLNQLPEIDNTKIEFLSEYWDPILQESNEIIERKIKNLKNPTVKKIETIKPGVFEDIV